jgi:hypothetical protein
VTHEGRKLTQAEAREWLHATGVTRRGPHQFNRKVAHWPYCGRCGLMMLKNEVSRKACKAQCQWEDD